MAKLAMETKQPGLKFLIALSIQGSSTRSIQMYYTS